MWLKWSFGPYFLYTQLWNLIVILLFFTRFYLIFVVYLFIYLFILNFNHCLVILNNKEWGKWHSRIKGKFNQSWHRNNVYLANSPGSLHSNCTGTWLGLGQDPSRCAASLDSGDCAGLFWNLLSSVDSKILFNIATMSACRMLIPGV